MGKTQPRNFSLEDLAALVNDTARNFDVLLSKSSQWIDWETAAFIVGDATVVSVDPGDKWPLRIVFGREETPQSAPFDSKMKFYCKSR